MSVTGTFGKLKDTVKTSRDGATPTPANASFSELVTGVGPAQVSTANPLPVQLANQVVGMAQIVKIQAESGIDLGHTVDALKVDVAAQTLPALKISRNGIAPVPGNASFVELATGTGPAVVTAANPLPVSISQIAVGASQNVNIHDKDGGGITSSTSIGIIRALDVAIKSTAVANPADTVWEKQELKTPTTAKTTVVEHIVQTGKDFYITDYTLNRLTDNNVGFQPATLEVVKADTTIEIFDQAGASSITDTIEWKEHLGEGKKIATAGDKVRLTVTPTGTGGGGGTTWFGKILGTTRPAGA